jgi:hypothetical protein
MRGGKKIIWLIVIIIIAIGFIWWRKEALKNIGKNIDDKQTTQPKVDQAQLADAYKNSLQALLPEYKNALATSTAETINNMRQKLLDLKLPAEFRDLHAQLVLLLDQTESAGKIGAGNFDKKLEEIIGSYDWLKLKIEN